MKEGSQYHTVHLLTQNIVILLQGRVWKSKCLHLFKYMFVLFVNSGVKGERDLASFTWAESSRAIFSVLTDQALH